MKHIKAREGADASSGGEQNNTLLPNICRARRTDTLFTFPRNPSGVVLCARLLHCNDNIQDPHTFSRAPPPPQPLAFLCFPSPSALKKKLLLCGCQRALNRCHICGGTVSAPFMRWICSSAFGFHGFLDLQIRVQSHLLIALQLLNSKIGVEWAAHPVQATWQLQRKSNSR